MKVLLKNDVDSLAIANSLRTQTFDELERSNFSFNTLKRQKISFARLDVKNLASFSYLNGASTETLICSMYERIRILQSLAKTAAQNKKAHDHIRFDVRLQNIAKMLLLLVLHLKS